MLAYFKLPLPPIKAVSSSIFSRGKGVIATGFRAMDISFIGLSSAAIRLDESWPQMRQRWMMAHSLFLRTQTAIGSIIPPQSAARSPGSISRCRLLRQLGQWLRWLLPAPAATTGRPQTLQVKPSVQG